VQRRGEQAATIGHLDDIDVLREDMLPARFDEREVIDGAREAAARIASRLGLDPRPRWPLVETDERMQSEGGTG